MPYRLSSIFFTQPIFLRGQQINPQLMLSVGRDEQRNIEKIAFSEGQAWSCVAGQCVFEGVFPEGFREDVAFLWRVLVSVCGYL